ncbi:putative chloride channel protein [Neospora caninum Liverpool]|uniref:Chloride channel protein, putative n=1 Tax=Neospora caninum (strain Liverpool) TaxID=572307 RepID=F0VC52_NEOCL|nr:putative chloride channel protein [Neospora caninum Liverpool]CBZ51186.1 putative chloride channel protein [Neospora caninum Liverpool]CEL68497.1 TPA: chloride channel protein, putative [Neospora caninum Liverpool]|eukprot:XP_003881219.1 putative chloride channel protein [Neospora caninum Liverpool]
MAPPLWSRGHLPSDSAASQERGLPETRSAFSPSPPTSSRPPHAHSSTLLAQRAAVASHSSPAAPSHSSTSPSSRQALEGEALGSPRERRRPWNSHSSSRRSPQKSSSPFAQPRAVHLRLSDWSRRDNALGRWDDADAVLPPNASADDETAAIQPPHLHLDLDFDVDAPSLCSPTYDSSCRGSPASSASFELRKCRLTCPRASENDATREIPWWDATGLGARRNLETPTASPLSSGAGHGACTRHNAGSGLRFSRFRNPYLRLTSEALASDNEAGRPEAVDRDRARDPGGMTRFLNRLQRLRQRQAACSSAGRRGSLGEDGASSKVSFLCSWDSREDLRRELRKKCAQCSRVWRTMSRDQYSGAHARSVNIVDLYAAYDEVHEAPHNANLHSQLLSRTLSPGRTAAAGAAASSVAEADRPSETDPRLLAPSAPQQTGAFASAAAPTAVKRCLLATSSLPGGERISLWIALVLIGILTALVSYFLDWIVDFVFLPLQESAVQRHSYAAIFVYSVACAVVATGCCLLVPQSQGSGIPELRTILSGSFLPDFCSWPTFFARCVGLLACICGGLSVGKEGPFVHLSAILATQLCRLPPLRSLIASPSKLLSILDVAVAAGVTATFGTPFGGVLFSIEVTATFFLVHALWKSYFCCIFCVLTFRLLHEKLSPIEQLYQGAQLPSFDLSWEILNFAFLGAICGCLGGLFVWAASKIFQLARRHVYPSAGRKIIFVCGVMLVLNILSQHSVVLKSEDRLKLSEFFDVENLDSKWGSHVLFSLFLFVLFKFAATILSVACPVPAGIFTPIFVCGAALGRLYGMLFRHFVPTLSSPAAYALVGAASLAAGTTRTISVSVIVFELTGKLSHMIPVLLAVLIAYGVNGFFTISVYDVMLLIKDLPYVPKLKSMHAYNLQAKDIMAATAYIRGCARQATLQGERRGERTKKCTGDRGNDISYGLSKESEHQGGTPLSVQIELPWIRTEQEAPDEKGRTNQEKKGTSVDWRSRCSSPIPLLLEERGEGDSVLMQSEEGTSDSTGESAVGVSLWESRDSVSGVHTPEMGAGTGGYRGCEFMPRGGEGQERDSVVERMAHHGFDCLDEFPSPEEDQDEDTFIVAIEKDRGTVLDLVFCRLLYAGVAIPVVSSVAQPRVEGAVSLSALDRYLSSLDISVSPSAPSPAPFSPFTPFSPQPLRRSLAPGLADAHFPRRKRPSLRRLGSKVRRLLAAGYPSRHTSSRRGRDRRAWRENGGGREREKDHAQREERRRSARAGESVSSGEEDEEEETEAGDTGTEGEGDERRSHAETGRRRRSSEEDASEESSEERKEQGREGWRGKDAGRGSVGVDSAHGPYNEQQRYFQRTDACDKGEGEREGTLADRGPRRERAEATPARPQATAANEGTSTFGRMQPQGEETHAEHTLAAVAWRILGRVLAVYSPAELRCLDSIPIDWTRLDVDAAPLCVLPETPVSKVHFMFTMLFLGQVFVSSNAGLLLGVITKQSLLQADEEATSPPVGRGGGRTSQGNAVWETFHLFSLLKREIRRLCKPRTTGLHARQEAPVRIYGRARG